MYRVSLSKPNAALRSKGKACEYRLVQHTCSRIQGLRCHSVHVQPVLDGIFGSTRISFSDAWSLSRLCRRATLQAATVELKGFVSLVAPWPLSDNVKLIPIRSANFSKATGDPTGTTRADRSCCASCASTALVDPFGELSKFGAIWLLLQIEDPFCGCSYNKSPAVLWSVLGLLIFGHSSFVGLGCTLLYPSASEFHEESGMRLL